MKSSKKTYNRGDELLKKFIAGSLSSQENDELTLLAKEDPFLQDALDGYQVETSVDHVKVIDEIKESKKTKPKYQLNILKYAATGILLISAGIWLFSYLSPDRSIPNDQLAVESTSEVGSNESFASNNTDRETELSKFQEEKISTASTKPLTEIEQEDDEVVENIIKNDRQNFKQLESPPIGGDPEIIEDLGSQETTAQTQPVQSPQDFFRAKQRILKDTLPQTELDDLVAILNEAEEENSEAGMTIPSPDDEAETDENIYHITGKVLDTDGEQLIGVTLVLQGTAFGSTSDLNGNFDLNLPTNDGTLEINYIGYETVYLPVSEFSTKTKIVLSPSNVSLDEVVVTALGSNRKNERKTRSSNSISDDQQILGYPVGGFSKFEKYLKDNKTYSDSENKNQIHGEVELQFIIMPNGQLDKIEVLKSIGNLIDNEAIRLLKEGPKWRTKPNGLEVKMKYRIRF